MDETGSSHTEFFNKKRRVKAWRFDELRGTTRALGSRFLVETIVCSAKTATMADFKRFSRHNDFRVTQGYIHLTADRKTWKKKWAKIDADNGKLAIYGEDPGTILFRLIGTEFLCQSVFPYKSSQCVFPYKVRNYGRSSSARSN